MTTTAVDTRPAMPMLPEVGSIVEVRGTTWAVTDVTEQGLSRSPADEARSGKQHVVSLQSLEEDRMGEELSVIWELEVGQTIIPSRGLPDVIDVDSFDEPNLLGAFVDAMRWGSATGSATGRGDKQGNKQFEAPFRTGANLNPYQLEPLRRAISAPRTNLLLADDVGLGKTIEAGMVIQELLLRHRARTVIIVCPPSLCLQWQAEMREKFGLDFVVVNSQTLDDARRKYGLGSNPFRLFPRVIVSMAWVPTIRAQRLFEEVYANTDQMNNAKRYSFDILVVDEAHHVAPPTPSVTGKVRGYAVDSKRTEAVRRLAEHCEHRLFLSATPHNGYSESFTALLEMIDPRRFTRGAGIDAEALKEVTVRRLKTQIRDLDFKKRKIDVIPYAPTPDEESHYELLDGILETTARERHGKRSLGLAALLFKKRLLSSPWAFSVTLSRYLKEPETEGWDPFSDDYYTEVMGSGQSDEEEGLEAQPEFDALRRGKAENPLEAAQPGQLEDLVSWSHDFEAKPNSRLQALIDWLDSMCRPQGHGHWSDERVVVFTEYADTLDWIRTVLESRGYSADRLAVINGATATEERELIRARFNADPHNEPIRVLLATDAAGEGIDLQAYCHRLVNFDVPFNPSRLEQRIGRIDRYGQRQTPEIYYFRPSSGSSTYASDLEFMRRLVQKISVEQQDLGTVNPLIDRKIANRFLNASLNAPTAETTTADERTRQSNDAVNRMLAGDAALHDDLNKLEEDYNASKKQLHLSPQAELRVVNTALELTNQPTLIPFQKDGHVEDGVYVLPSLNRSWQPIAEHLRTLLDPDTIRPITFDPAIAKNRRNDLNVAYEHLGSELVAKASRTLRSNLYGQESKLHRVTAVVLPNLEHTCAAAVCRLVLVGRGGLRVHEEVLFTGLRFGAQNMGDDKAQGLLDTALDVSDTLKAADVTVLQRLCEAWSANHGRLRTRLENVVNRMAEKRQNDCAADLDAQRDADLDRAKGIFEQFRSNLRDSLQQLHEQDEESGQLTLDLWSDDERRQRQRDIRKMEDRLASLDEEEQRECDMIRTRYQDIKPYTSIAALVFAVSEKDAQAWEKDR